jgi:hypothetical protein
MRGRRTTLVPVVLAVLAATITSACNLGRQTDRDTAPGPTLVAVDPVGDGDPPEVIEAVEVEVGTAVAVFGRGCRPQSPHQRCSADGTKTYTLTGRLRPATVTGVWMQLDTGHGRWTVVVRLAGDDLRTAALVAERTREEGGLVVVLDARTGDVLQGVSPRDIRGTRITRRDLHRLSAENVVNAFAGATEAD